MIPIVTLPGPARFPLGNIGITDRAYEEIEIGDIVKALLRHENCDWGEAGPADRDANELALVAGARILSAYSDPYGTRFRIITEADRSATTVLLPSEY